MVSFGATQAPAAKAPEVPAELPPQVKILQPGVKLTMLAEHPDLVTPTGIDVDANGNIWVVSCHTHQRPEGYVGPERDEVVVFDSKGKNRRVFYNKTFQTMNLRLGPDGWVYLIQRDRILRVKDTDGDGKGDLEEDVIALDSVTDYPHNGLSGMTILPSGEMVFSLGENFGKDWVMSNRDGVKLSGRGEGGIFRSKVDGSGLRRIARGFWNPFGLMVREDGEIFTVDNDPGSRPPCRLLSIIEGADYGYQWVYGSAPVHPFVAWNGELRGTIGMIYPSGEGPCSIVELGGGVLVPSWSNHTIDYFPLNRKGAGYTSEQISLMHGSDFFRPTCLVAGPDGAFYFNDWVFSSYPVHGRGRLWKLEIDQSKATWVKPKADPMNEEAKLAKGLREGTIKKKVPELLKLARGSDAYLSDAALAALAPIVAKWPFEKFDKLKTADRVWAFVSLRRLDLNAEKWVRHFLKDKDPEIQFECLRWIADAVLTNFTADVEKFLNKPELDYKLFEAALAAWNTLRGNPGAGVTDLEVLTERVTNPDVPVLLKGYALRLIPAGHPKLKVSLLQDLLKNANDELALEVVRTLGARQAADARVVLAEVAADEGRSAQVRADAVAGLASSTQPEHRALLVKLAGSEQAKVRNEALRGLRFLDLDKGEKEALEAVAKKYPESAGLVKVNLDAGAINAGRPAFDDTDAWLKRLAAVPGKADVEAGRRIFFHSKLAICSTCHRSEGRGNVVGPDLTLVGQQGEQKVILQSILEPNREVAPQFYPTQLELADGTSFTGILLRSSHVDTFRDLTGKEKTFKKTDIAKRTELKSSVMPAGLVAMMTDEELRDLLVFLTGKEVKAPAK